MKSKQQIARDYYEAMGKKDLDALASMLDEGVEFKAPLGKASGKEALLESTQNFMKIFDQMKIVHVMAEGEQAIVVYDVQCNEPIGLVRSVALMKIREGLVTDVQLIYDTRPFLK